MTPQPYIRPGANGATGEATLFIPIAPFISISFTVTLTAGPDTEESPHLQGQPPASAAAIAALPIGHARKEDPPCSVCLDGFGEGDKVMSMPCGHPFHPECLTPWLGSSNTCPSCRYEIETGNREYDQGVEKRMRSRRPSHPSLPPFHVPSMETFPPPQCSTQTNQCMETEASPLVILRCGHSAHASCLLRRMRLRGERPCEEGLSALTSFLCPACHSPTHIVPPLSID